MIDAPVFLWAPVDDDAPSSPAPVPTARTHAPGLPGEVGLWVFVLGDMTIFGAFFSVFAWELRGNRGTFAESAAALHQPIGLVNTLLLLVSSYAVVVALHAYRRELHRPRQVALAAAMLCGLGFLGVKAVEYALEIGAGHTPGDNDFFTFYFVMTGVHALHVVIGLTLLTLWLRREPGGVGSGSGGRAFVEGAAVYWHMVDLLWIVIFGLLYLGAGA